MIKQQPPSGQGIHPPLNRLAFSVCPLAFKFCGDVMDIVDIFEGCWVIGMCFEDVCAAGGNDKDEVDWEDIMVL